MLTASTSGAFAMQPGDFSIRLQDRQGEAYDLGILELRQAGQHSYSYEIHWDENRFENHFLSMRPFKCVPHPVQLICHLPYPYEIHRVITEKDLTDLEYDLLFLHKLPNEYGISGWNGLYYRLSITDSGLAGELRETDLNVLQAPPEDGSRRPIDPAELYEASDKHWPRRLLIERLHGPVQGS
jgi:hypothetical protein